MKKADFTIFSQFLCCYFPETFATGSAKIGGTFVNSDETTFKVSVDIKRTVNGNRYLNLIMY